MRKVKPRGVSDLVQGHPARTLGARHPVGLHTAGRKEERKETGEAEAGEPEGGWRPRKDRETFFLGEG